MLNPWNPGHVRCRLLRRHLLSRSVRRSLPRFTPKVRGLRSNTGSRSSRSIILSRSVTLRHRLRRKTLFALRCSILNRAVTPSHFRRHIALTCPLGCW